MQTFNLQRFTRVCHQEWLTNYKQYLRTLGIILGVILVLVMWSIYSSRDIVTDYAMHDPTNSTLKTFFWIGLFIYACVAGSQTFQPLESKLSSINALMLPGSQLEKYLARWILMVPLALILYFCGYLIIDIIHYLGMKMIHHDFSAIHFFGYFSGLDCEDIWLIASSLVSLQSFFVLGSSLWPKRALWATFASLFLIAWALSLWIFFVAMMRFSDGSWSMSYCYYDCEESSSVFFICLRFFIALVNYTLAYFRYREAEIINRW